MDNLQIVQPESNIFAENANYLILTGNIYQTFHK
jgi:hypothetical protein